ncbi:hypothetical protein ACFYZE_18215 [Streptomyces sp. NPDC001796]|uniref:hypothetical protein n=1 Tax=Streptomyces sp. NPDC001796 TaxID=3364609 RepID=UPI0036BD9108
MMLFGGTPNVGKSSVARELADRHGFAYRSTDGPARHPGRPWRTPEREVPAHVTEHHAALGVEELTQSVLRHYERLWPRIAELFAAERLQSIALDAVDMLGSTRIDVGDGRPARWPTRYSAPVDMRDGR